MRSILFIIFMVGGIFVPVTSYAQQNLSAEEAKIYVDAINMLPDSEQDFLYAEAEAKKVGIITYLNDNQLKDFGFSKDVVKVMKAKAMFVLGEKPTLPMYVRRESKFYTSILDLYQQTKTSGVNIAAMALAAKVSHELYHVQNSGKGGEDEALAVTHEKEIFLALAQKHKSAIGRAGLEKLVASYVASLESDRLIAARD